MIVVVLIIIGFSTFASIPIIISTGIDVKLSYDIHHLYEDPTTILVLVVMPEICTNYKAGEGGMSQVIFLNPVQ